MNPEYFQSLARYNAWANRKLYQALSQLGEDEIVCERPSFFGSILATLNHGLVGDRNWLARLEMSRESYPLDEILYEDFSDLRSAREDFDDRIIGFTDKLTPSRVSGNLSYYTSAGELASTPTAMVLAHMFNHATHHRGQVHDMMSQTDVAPPAMDIIYFLRDGG